MENNAAGRARSHVSNKGQGRQRILPEIKFKNIKTYKLIVLIFFIADAS